MLAVFNIDKSFIKELDDENARELVARLCRAELRSQSISDSAVKELKCYLLVTLLTSSHNVSKQWNIDDSTHLTHYHIFYYSYNISF